MIDDPETLLAGLAAEMAAGTIIPYLGPGVLVADGGEPVVPAGARELAHVLASRVAVPGRIRNNLWHSAQYIETFRHRVTLDRLLSELYAPIPPPGPLQRWLAGLECLPLIIDTWYDGTMRAALAGRSDWGQIQGASKARRTGDAPWHRATDNAGRECPSEAAEHWKTVLYKPHGAAQPDGDVLASDADYVEVLTDLDIQIPIPEAVKQRRKGRGFLFLGCRFYDQILRSFARALIRHSGGPRFAVLPDDLTKNEIRFLESENIVPITMPLARAIGRLAG